MFGSQIGTAVYSCNAVNTALLDATLALPVNGYLSSGVSALSAPTVMVSKLRKSSFRCSGYRVYSNAHFLGGPYRDVYCYLTCFVTLRMCGVR